MAPAGFAEDVERRDFTVNTMAVSVLEPGRLIDPLDGERDLRRRALRALHDGSFVDDPTRALRAARYTARLGLVVEAGTLARLRATDLATVSADRVTAELRRLAGEPTPRHGFELLDEWGLVPLANGAAELIDAIDELLAATAVVDVRLSRGGDRRGRSGRARIRRASSSQRARRAPPPSSTRFAVAIRSS